MNPGPHGEKLATNHLSLGIAKMYKESELGLHQISFLCENQSILFSSERTKNITYHKWNSYVNDVFMKHASSELLRFRIFSNF
jgi:hypothetical protein